MTHTTIRNSRQLDKMGTLVGVPYVQELWFRYSGGKNKQYVLGGCGACGMCGHTEDTPVLPGMGIQAGDETSSTRKGRHTRGANQTVDPAGFRKLLRDVKVLERDGFK